MKCMHILSLSLMLTLSKCHHYTRVDQAIRTIGEGMELVTDMTDALHEKDPKIFFDAVLCIANLIPQGIIRITKGINLLLSILGGGNPNAEDLNIMQMHNGFSTVYRKLDEIDRILDDVIPGIHDQFENASLKLRIDNVGFLQNSLEYYSRHPNNRVLKRIFLKSCSKHSMQDIMVWLHKEITRKTTHPLLDAMKRSNDRKVFLAWSKQVMSTFLQASVLHDVCLAAMVKNWNGDCDEYLDLRGNGACKHMKNILAVLKAEDEWFADMEIEDKHYAALVARGLH